MKRRANMFHVWISTTITCERWARTNWFGPRNNKHDQTRVNAQTLFNLCIRSRGTLFECFVPRIIRQKSRALVFRCDKAFNKAIRHRRVDAINTHRLKAIWKIFVSMQLKQWRVNTYWTRGDYDERIGMYVTHVERVIFIESTDACIRMRWFNLPFMSICIFITCFPCRLSLAFIAIHKYFTSNEDEDKRKKKEKKITQISRLTLDNDSYSDVIEIHDRQTFTSCILLALRWIDAFNEIQPSSSLKLSTFTKNWVNNPSYRG